MVNAVFPCLLLSSVMVFSGCERLNGYQFPVYSTESCPRNEKEWLQRSSVLNCTVRNGYMCMPNEKLTTLLEFCYKQSKILIEEGICLFLTKDFSAVDNYKCHHFSGGCPDLPYFSNKMYKYKNCLYIGKGCFLAEPSCYTTSLAYTNISTSINNIPIEANGTNLIWIQVVTPIAVVIVICVFYSICQCYRNNAGDVTMPESVRGTFYRLQPASQDAGRVLDEATGKSSGIPTDYQ